MVDWSLSPRRDDWFSAFLTTKTARILLTIYSESASPILGMNMELIFGILILLFVCLLYFVAL